jgi:hypothetical protein
VKAPGALALLLALSVTACSGDDSSSDDSRERPFVPSSSASGRQDAVDLAATDVCAKVREGIDAFNVGDLEGTISTFEEAIPLAEDLADSQPSDDTRVLLDAVRYYAGIPARDYLEASQSSSEFLRFKTFTLDRCAYVGPPAEATDPAIPA